MPRCVVASPAALLAAVCLAAACADGAGEAAPLRLWHTFGPEETGALNADLERIRREERIAARATVLPFWRAQNRLTDVLRSSDPWCPDLARVDATWVPGLAGEGLLRELSDPALAADMTDEAAELARHEGKIWGLPQALDGLALLHGPRVRADAGADWPPRDLAALERAARGLMAQGRFGLSLRADGYWFVAFLRAAGGELLDPRTGEVAIARPEAVAALARYAALTGPGGVAPPPVLGGDEAGAEARRFAAGEVAVIVGGPWTVAALAREGARDLAVSPYPRGPGGEAAAPRGGHVYVVPRCARHPEEAWRLAAALTAPARQVAWSRGLGVVPTRRAALEQASPIARAFAESLQAARTLPREADTPLLFDDLTPAIEAVLAGDATPEEALGGVDRAWRRLRAGPGERRP